MKTISKSLIAFGAVIVLVTAGTIWYFATKKTDPELSMPLASQENLIRIVAFGDSLTAGYGLTLDQAYPSLLEKALRERGYEVEVVNSGVSGETSAGGVRRAEFIRSLDPDIVLFGLGGNDALRLLPSEDMEKNLNQALTRLRAGDDAPQVLLLGMRAPGNADRVYREAFDAVSPRLAKKYSLPLVPFFLEGVALDPRFTIQDGIHPNQAGYQFIVEKTLLPEVEKLLASPFLTLSPKETSLDRENESGDKTQFKTTTPILSDLFTQEFDGREFTVEQTLEKNSAYTRYFVTYKSGELTISGIMNVPTGDGPFPLLILNHGYIDTSIYTNGRGLKREQDYLARQGFVVIHPDYRNHAQSSRIDEGEIENRIGYVKDVINLVYAVRASDLPYIDKTRIGMMGHSMGGGIAQSVAVAQPNLVKAMVLYAPISMDYRDSYYHYMADNKARAESVASRYGLPEDNPEFWSGISPETYADRVNVPILLFQGTRDESVLKAWSDKTNALLKEKGKAVEYIVYEGEGHEFGPKWNDFMQKTTTFFRKHL